MLAARPGVLEVAGNMRDPGIIAIPIQVTKRQVAKLSNCLLKGEKFAVGEYVSEKRAIKPKTLPARSIKPLDKVFETGAACLGAVQNVAYEDAWHMLVSGKRLTQSLNVQMRQDTGEETARSKTDRIGLSHGFQRRA